MNAAKHIELSEWADFEFDLRARLRAQNFGRIILFRAFLADRLPTAIAMGTDRDAESCLWNVDGFDHDHDVAPAAKTADAITYVHRINPNSTPFTVLNLGEEHTEDATDLTDRLTEIDGVLIYDSKYLDRKAPNEHWFKGAPSEALMFIYTLREDEDEAEQ